MDSDRPIQRPQSEVKTAYDQGRSDAIHGNPLDYNLYPDNEVLHRAYTTGHRDGHMARKQRRIR